MRTALPIEKAAAMGIHFEGAAMDAWEPLSDALKNDFVGNAFASPCIAAMLFTMHGLYASMAAEQPGSSSVGNAAASGSASGEDNHWCAVWGE